MAFSQDELRRPLGLLNRATLSNSLQSACHGRSPGQSIAEFQAALQLAERPKASTPMERGISEQSKLLRRHLLNHNASDVMKWMQESRMADPVGMIVEMTDDIGKQLTYAALEKQGMPRHEIPELIASYCKNAIPTFKCVVSFETAKKILPITSETALRNLTAPRRPGVHWIVVVGGGGNSYAQVPIGD